MNKRILLAPLTVVALLFWAMAKPVPVLAHCDSVNGPVVRAARAAIEQQNVALVLGWVRPQTKRRCAKRSGARWRLDMRW